MRIVFRATVLLVCFLTLIISAKAQTEFPNRPVRILVGFAPGGTTDLLARIVADELRNIWKSTVVVENHPGADGIIVTTMAHNAPADGYTLLMSTNAIVITPHLKKLSYNPLTDFEPITIVGREYHHLLVTPDLPVKTVREFIDLAKSSPNGLTFSSAGPGSAPFLAMQRFMQAAELKNMIHVPYPGSLPAAMGLVSGDVQSMFSSPSTTLPLTSEGKIRILAVAGPVRDPNVPDVPTMAEAGIPDFTSDTWFALMAPAGIPADVLRKIQTDVIVAMKSSNVINRIKQMRSVPVGNSAAEFREIIKRDFAEFKKTIENAK